MKPAFKYDSNCIQRPVLLSYPPIISSIPFYLQNPSYNAFLEVIQASFQCPDHGGDCLLLIEHARPYTIVYLYDFLFTDVAGVIARIHPKPCGCRYQLATLVCPFDGRHFRPPLTPIMKRRIRNKRRVEMWLERD